MKRNLLMILAVSGCILGGHAADKSMLKDLEDKFYYSQGVNYGRYIQRQGLDLKFEAFNQGLKDALADGDLLLTDEEMQQVLTEIRPILKAKQEEYRKVLSDKNKKEGEEFLAANKKKDGVITLPSGLQYRVINEGNGAVPKATDIIQANYKGTFVNGKEFDSSIRRGRPLEIGANQVIKGWTEALTMMKVGAKWELFIPSELAYGEGGRANIPPSATLIFEMELLGIKTPPEQTAPPTPSQPVTSDIIKVPSAEELKKGAKIEVIKADQVPAEAAKEKK